MDDGGAKGGYRGSKTREGIIKGIRKGTMDDSIVRPGTGNKVTDFL